MRRVVIILLIFVFLLTACLKEGEDINANQLSENCSLDDVKSSKYVVFEDNDITYGQSTWDEFITAIDNGKSATVRLAYYFTLGESSQYSKELYEEIKDDYPVLFIRELNYDGEKYSIKVVIDDQISLKEYKYLVKLEGETSGKTTNIFKTTNTSKTTNISKYTYYVLVNDDTVTWDDIVHGMASSQSDDYIDHYKVYSDLVFK